MLRIAQYRVTSGKIRCGLPGPPSSTNHDVAHAEAGAYWQSATAHVDAWHDALMSTSPNGPNVPPPPGQGGSYDQNGQPGPQPPRNGLGKGIIAAIVAVVVLFVLVIVLGGVWLVQSSSDDQADPTTSPTSATSPSEAPTSELTSTSSANTTSSSTTEPSSSSTSSASTSQSSSTDSAQGVDINFPDQFAGWTKTGGDRQTAGHPSALYAKGDLRLAVGVTQTPVSTLKEGLTNSQEVDGAYCGKSTSQMACIREKDGTSYVMSVPGTAHEVAGYLDAFLEVM